MSGGGWATTAGAAGAHALGLFALLLTGVLAAATALWWTWQRHLLPRWHGSPRALLAIGVATGFATLIGAATLFAELAEALHATDTLGAADQALADAIRVSVPLPVLRLFATLSHLADPITQTAICIGAALALAWRGQRALALGWVAAIAGNGTLNTSLKHVFARVRPVHDDGLVLADGYSFPSGHSSASVVIFGMAAYTALRLLPARWHLPALLGALAAALAVGASRVLLRVHFASDVLAGFASGAIWLTICIASLALSRRDRIRRRRSAPSSDG